MKIYEMSKRWQNVSRQGKLDYMKRNAKGTSRRDRPVYLLPAEPPSSAPQHRMDRHRQRRGCE